MYRLRETGVLHMRFFDWKKVRLLFGFTIFLILLILNCVMYCNKAGMKRDLTVVIDVGHGGNDPGKIGVDNVKEKDVNLQIALCLKAQLQARGVKVILTREGDVCLATNGATNKKVSDMHNRVSLINASGADYMISIHQNSYPEAEISGPQVFYYGSSEMSKKLAEAIQAQLIVDLQPPKEREIKTGNDLYILKNSQCPGVIVECGFLSNPTECENLQNPQYQQAVAAAIARAICKL